MLCAAERGVTQWARRMASTLYARSGMSPSPWLSPIQLMPMGDTVRAPDLRAFILGALIIYRMFAV